MTTHFNGREFTVEAVRTFTPTFEGAQSRRDRNMASLITRRNARRDRRANRAI